MPRWFAALLAASVSAATGCAGTPSHVVRVVDGYEQEGPYIGPEAYALYLQGAFEEQHGDFERALSFYRDALSIDSDSVELWTRIGALECRLHRVAPEQAFRPALSLDEDYAPLWIEISRCHRERRELSSALEAAMRAARLAPLEDQTTVAVTMVLDDLGRTREAERWRRAREHLVWQASARHAPDTVAPNEAAALVDAALVANDLAWARRAAIAAGLGPGELAARAIRRGKAELALEQARFVLRADPDNAEAWLAALAASDLLGDDAQLRDFLKRAPSSLDDLSSDARAVASELFGRRGGQSAAEALTGALGAPPSPRQGQ